MNTHSTGFIKYISKKFLNKLHYQQKSNLKDIFIFSSFRSGSTWLAELIKSQKGIKFAISPNKINLLENIDDYYKQIDNRPYYLKLSQKEEEIIKNYINKTSSGKLIYARRYVDLFSKDHSFINNRTVYRLLRSNYLINWYDQNFNIHPIYLLRHPIAASLSRKKIWERSPNPDYWKSNTKYLLNSDYFVNKYLNQKLYKFLKHRVNNASILEDFIISWCLENLMLIQKIQSNTLKQNIIYLNYEDILIHPKKVINHLSQKLQLNEKDKIFKKINLPSSTVRYSNQETKDKFAEHNYDRCYLLSKWKNQLDKDEEKSIFELINRFGIKIYQKDKLMPASEYLIK
ncbi:MAG: sulfotransferase domain-containing protein [Halanaerobium sp.]